MFAGKLKTQLIASYVCATLVLLVGLVAFVQSHEVAEAMERATQLRLLIANVLEAEQLVLNAETSQRGYMLTSDQRYLAPYNDATPLIDAKLRQVEDLTRASSTAQKQRVAQLVMHCEAKLAELAATLEAFKRGESVRDIVRDHAGESLSIDIRKDVSAIMQEARLRRDQEQGNADRLHAFAQWFMVVGNAIAFVLAAAATAWLGTAFRASNEARERVERLAQTLKENAERLAKQETQLEHRLVEESLLRKELERAFAALKRTNADLEQFAYVASHDLRAPLRGITSLADWIQEDIRDALTPETRQHFIALQSRVRRLDALVVGIAAYSRAGNRLENVETVDVSQLVHDVIDLVAAPPTVSVQVQSPMPTLATARVPLQQVFLNLLSNAVKHGVVDGQGEITLHCEDAGSAWKFSVRDRGPGIEPEYHQRIFDLFQTLASRDRVEGTGIGLAVVKKLVRRYGGEVSVQSTVGEGTTFSFTWPKRPVVTDEGAVAHG